MAVHILTQECYELVKQAVEGECGGRVYLEAPGFSPFEISLDVGAIRCDYEDMTRIRKRFDEFLEKLRDEDITEQDRLRAEEGLHMYKETRKQVTG